MTNVLHLDGIRGVLIRLEETLIFGCIERAHFPVNAVVYEPGALGGALGGESLLDYLLHECERAHARVRRYTSPDELPYFDDLPAPVLPPLAYRDNPLVPTGVNLNTRIKAAYCGEMIPHICRPGDDRNYGSSAVCDVALLQALSKRIHYGRFVAESKYRERPRWFDAMIRAGDADALEAAITVPEVEDRLFERVRRKTATYGGELAAAGEPAMDPEVVAAIYRRWIVPLSKEVEVRYLLARPG